MHNYSPTLAKKTIIHRLRNVSEIKYRFGEIMFFRYKAQKDEYSGLYDSFCNTVAGEQNEQKR